MAKKLLASHCNFLLIATNEKIRQDTTRTKRYNKMSGEEDHRILAMAVSTAVAADHPSTPSTLASSRTGGSSHVIARDPPLVPFLPRARRLLAEQAAASRLIDMSNLESPAESEEVVVVDAGVANALSVANLSRKRVNVDIRNQFRVESGSFALGGSFLCTHCKRHKVEWKNWNSTKASNHLLVCESVPNDLKIELAETSQASKKKKRDLISLSVASSNGGSFGDAMKTIVARSKKGTSSNGFGSPTTRATSRKLMEEATKPRWERSVMTQETADKIIMAQVEASLIRFEPPARICDPNVLTALAAACGSGIMTYMPSAPTIFDTYVTRIDKFTKEYMTNYMKRTSGNITIAFDGVTVLGSSHILYTCSKGELSMFVKLSQLGSDVHVSEKEVTDCVDQLVKVKADIGGSICNAAMDNAAIHVAEAVIKEYAIRFPSEPPILKTRDPAHCIDLVAKDSAEVPCFASLMTQTKAVIKLLNTDRIQGCITEATFMKKIPFIPKANILSETRIYGAADMFNGVLKSKPALSILADLDSFIAYRNTRSSTVVMDRVMGEITPEYYRKLQVAVKWFGVLKSANKLVSSESCPMSAYLPIIQATRNELNSALNNDGGVSFDELFGMGSRQQLVEFVRSRFNMNGVDPPGRKKGLIDRYQIWAHLIDPYAR